MKIHVAYAINEQYVKYCLVSMISLIYSNKDVHIVFHILTDRLSYESQNKFKRLVEPRDGEVNFYTISDEQIANLSLNGWGKQAWYRLFLPNLLSEDIDKVLYLDVDTIVAGDICDLFSIDMCENSLAGCMDYMGFNNEIYERIGYAKEYGYICSGVILFNLDYFRRHDLSRRIMDFARENPCKIIFPDQDAINAVCHDTMKLLPLKYDILAPFFTDLDFINNHTEDVKEMLRSPKIIHYAGCNPWKKEISNHYYDEVYWRYAKMIGGVERKRMITGTALIKHKIKILLGYLGFSQFKKYRPKPKQDFSYLNSL